MVEEDACKDIPNNIRSTNIGANLLGTACSVRTTPHRTTLIPFQGLASMQESDGHAMSIPRYLAKRNFWAMYTVGNSAARNPVRTSR